MLTIQYKQETKNMADVILSNIANVTGDSDVIPLTLTSESVYN